jgi:hypothetical protein
MENLAIEGLKGACLLGALVGVMAGCGGASSGQGSEPAKSTASPASSAGTAAGPAGTGAGGAPGPDQINAVLKDHSRELKVCYDKDKDRGMLYRGETKFRVKLSPAGKVEDVQGVDVSPQGEFLSACVSESMKDWTFPSSSKGGSITFAVPWR